MIDNRTFGNFIREKRLEKGLKQRELADLLYVTESAVSKWETGKSYPDITMIPNICKTLGVTEKELIEGANDTEYHKMRTEAKLYRRISEAWFWGLSISYGIALLVCVICDLAINHRFSFSVTVFASLAVAFSFAPTWIRFTERHKLAVFAGSSYLSLCFLFLVCNVSGGGSWFLIACAGVLLGYISVFSPFLIRRYLPELGRSIRPLIYFCFMYLGILLLFLSIRVNILYPLFKANLICLYAMLPFFVLSLVHLLRMDRLLKASIDVLTFGVVYYRIQSVVDALFGGGEIDYYKVDFSDWSTCMNGNIALIFLLSAITVAVVLAALSFVRRKSR